MSEKTELMVKDDIKSAVHLHHPLLKLDLL